MANGLNQVNLLGNVGADPELKTAGNTPMLSLRLAINEDRKQNDGTYKEHTEWVSCTLWGKRAESLAPYIKKGDKIYITGRFQTRTVEKDGDKKYYSGVNVDNVILLGGKKGASDDSGQVPFDAPSI